MLKQASWIIGSSEFFHSFIFAMQKNHSYQIPSQNVLARLLCRLDSALAKIRVLDLLHAHRLFYHPMPVQMLKQAKDDVMLVPGESNDAPYVAFESECITYKQQHMLLLLLLVQSQPEL